MKIITLWKPWGFITAIVLLMTARLPAVDFIQWKRSAGGNGHYYGITDSRTNWLAAESAAMAMGGHLASITSAAEQAFVVSNLVTGAYDRLPLWIGLTDLTPYGGGVGTKVYSKWTSGESVSYTRWHSGEPNNHTPGEDYVAINWHRAANQSEIKGTWNDTPLNGSTLFGGTSTGPYYGIVELDLEPLLSFGICDPQNGLVTLKWNSVSNRLYTVQCSTNLSTGFFPLQTDLPASPPTNSWSSPILFETMMFWKVSTPNP